MMSMGSMGGNFPLVGGSYSIGGRFPKGTRRKGSLSAYNVFVKQGMKNRDIKRQASTPKARMRLIAQKWRALKRAKGMKTSKKAKKSKKGKKSKKSKKSSKSYKSSTSKKGKKKTKR